MEARCTQLLAPLARLGSGSTRGAAASSSAVGGPPSTPTSAVVLELVASVACEPWSTLTDGKLLGQLLQVGLLTQLSRPAHVNAYPSSQVLTR